MGGNTGNQLVDEWLGNCTQMAPRAGERTASEQIEADMEVGKESAHV